MADQMINALPTKTEPVTGDKVLLSGASEEYLIDYDKLATAILNKLTSKTFTLDQGTKTFVAALNELNSKSFFTSGGIALTSESDFNNYADFGNYYCASTSYVRSMKNKPKKLTVAFSMKVFAGNGERYPTQLITDLDGNMWIRTRVDDMWNSWSQFSSVKDS